MTDIADPDPMMTVPSGVFWMGAEDHYPEEGPVRPVEVDAFRIDRHPVTNRQFARFVAATGYVTVAERPLDPADYPGVGADRLVPGALVFRAPRGGASAGNVGDWWVYVPDAQWRRPEAATTVFAGRLDHPVTCVTHEDAAAYAAWAGKRLPTEAEWECAARGGIEKATYAWGNEMMPGGKRMANIWMGEFPHGDRRPKGHRTTRVGSFPCNGYGLVDMIGNVWEWTSDWYRTDCHTRPASSCCLAPDDSYDPEQPHIRIPSRVLKGGSFLCAPNYCARYRPAARQAQMVDTASVHIGFRCAVDADS